MEELIVVIFILLAVLFIVRTIATVSMSHVVKELNQKLEAMQGIMGQMAEKQAAFLDKLKTCSGEERATETETAEVAAEKTVPETIEWSNAEEGMAAVTMNEEAVPAPEELGVVESPEETIAEISDAIPAETMTDAAALTPAEESPCEEETLPENPDLPDDDKVPAVSRVPSAFQMRLRNIGNWLLYGRLEGLSSGDQLEKVLATTWLLRFGILVILFTSAFLLKLSIDRGILSPSGRVALSYFAGAALFFGGISRRMRENYWRFGQALIGLGFGLFYFSSYAMLGMYHLAPVWVAGCIMCLTTLAAGVLSDRLNSMTIAMVAMFGGYATPAMLSTGTANFPGLGIYLALLGCGVLWLANRRNWQQLTWIAMIFAYCIFGAACKTHFTESDCIICIIALTVFFIQFSTSVFLHNVRHRIQVSPLEIVSLLLNSGLYFGLVAWIIDYVSGIRLAFAPLCLGLALFYIAHVWFFMRKRVPENRNLLLVFCGLSALYLALTMPMVLSSDWLGSAWAIIALVVLWLEQSVKSRFLRRLAFALFGLSLFHIIGWEWSAYGRGGEIDYYVDNPDDVSWNFWLGVVSRCIRFLTPVVCLALAGRIERKKRANEDYAENSEAVPCESTDGEKQLEASGAERFIPAIFVSVAFVLLVFFATAEVTFVFNSRCLWLHWPAMTVTWLLALLLTLHLSHRQIPGCWKIFQILLIAVLIVGGVVRFFEISRSAFFCYQVPYDAFWLPAWGRLLNCFAFIGGLRYFSRALLDDGRKANGTLDWLGKTAWACNWIWPILLFLFATTEWNTIIVYKIPGLAGGGVSVLWAVFAFTAIFFGLKNRNAIQRYVGLGLFAVVVYKVFFIDMSQFDAMYRVVAFLIFGILLMAAAFIYFKCWKQRNDE